MLGLQRVAMTALAVKRAAASIGVQIVIAKSALRVVNGLNQRERLVMCSLRKILAPAR